MELTSLQWRQETSPQSVNMAAESSSQPITRQLSLGSPLHVQRVLGDNNLASLIFESFTPDFSPGWLGLSGSCRLLARALRSSQAVLMHRKWLAQQRERLTLWTRLARQAMRSRECFEYAIKLIACVTAEAPVTLDERQLLVEAFMFWVAELRSSIRMLKSAAATRRDTDEFEHLASRFTSRLVSEYCAACERVAGIANRLAQHGGAESGAYFLILRARYQVHSTDFSTEGSAEVQTARWHAVDEAFGDARHASSVLPPTHPTRLGLALFESTFLYERRVGRQDEACALLQQAFDDAQEQLETLDEESAR